jgi:hypothetical protein
MAADTHTGDAHRIAAAPRLHPLAPALARVFDDRGEVVGAAFLVSDTTLLTCSHVVEEAVGAAAESVTVDFPFLESERTKCKVGLRRPVDDQPPADIAVLSLKSRVPKSRPVRLLAPPNLAGRAFEVCGFPEGNDAGAWAEGRTGFERADGTLQVGDPNQTGYPIQPGFSGAPLWDVVNRGIIGMVVARERDTTTKVAFVQPLDAVNTVVPLDLAQVHDPYAILTAGVEDSWAGLNQFLAEYLGKPDRLVAFGGRGRELDALDHWLASSDPACGVLVAPAGRGKTALLTRWVAAVAANRIADVALLPVSTRFGTGTLTAALLLLRERLRNLLNMQPDAVPDPSALRSEIERLLRDDREPGAGPLLVVIDGADEAADWQLGRELRIVPGRGVRVLVAARRTVDRSAADWIARLYWHGIAESFELDPLDREGVADVLLSIGIERISSSAVDRLFHLTGGDPLELQLYAQSIAGGMDPERLDDTDTPPGLDGFFTLWWEDQEQQWADQNRLQLAESEDVRRLLNILALAHGPLNKDELAELGGGRLNDGTYLERKLSELGRFVIPTATGDAAAYVLAHPKLNSYFSAKMTSAERAAIDEDLFAYCSAALDDPSRASQYAVRYLGVYAEARRDASAVLYALVQPAWQKAWKHFSQSATGFATDVDRAWRRAQDEVAAATGPEQRLGPLQQEIRCALVQSSLSTQASRLQPELIFAMLKAELWTPDAALEFARRQTDPEARRNALACLAPLLSQGQLEEVWSLIKSMPGEVDYRVYKILIPYLPQSELDSLIEAARKRSDAPLESEALLETALRQQVPEKRAEMVEKAWAAATRAPAWGNVLLRLSPLISRDRLAQTAASDPVVFARLLLQVDDDEDPRSDDINELLRLVPAQAVAAIEEAARELVFAFDKLSFTITISVLSERAVTLGKLIGRLEPQARSNVLAELTDKHRFNDILVGVAASVSDAEAPAAMGAVMSSLSDACDQVVSICEQLSSRLTLADLERIHRAIREHEDAPAEAYGALAGIAPEQMILQIHADVLECFGSGEDFNAVHKLWPLFPESERDAVMDRTVERLVHTDVADDHQSGLISGLPLLAPLMSPTLRERALFAIRTIRRPHHRAHAMLRFADGIADSQRASILRDAFDAAQTIDDEETSSLLIDLGGSVSRNVNARLSEYFRADRRVPPKKIAEAAISFGGSPSQLHAALNDVLDLEARAALPQVKMLARYLGEDDIQQAAQRVAAWDDVEKAVPVLYALGGADPSLIVLADRLIDGTQGGAKTDLLIQATAETRMQHLGEILAALRGEYSQISDRFDRRLMNRLLDLSRGLPLQGQRQVLVATAWLQDDYMRSEFLGLLAQDVTDGAESAVLDAVLSLDDELRRAVALSALVSRLSGSTLELAKQASNNLEDDLSRLIAAASMLHTLDPPKRLELARRLIDICGDVEPAEENGGSLIHRYVPGMVPLDSAWVTRIAMITVPFLPHNERRHAIELAVRWLQPFDADWKGTVLLEGAEDLASAGLFDEALDVVSAIPEGAADDGWDADDRRLLPYRAQALSIVAREAVAQQIPVSRLIPLWQDLLLAGTGADRAALASMLSASLSLLNALGDPCAADTVAEAILEVKQWIP